MTPFRSTIALAVSTLLLACGDTNKPSMAEALEDAAKRDEKEKKAKEEADAKAAAQKVEKKVDPKELPWTFDALKAGLLPGTRVKYSLTGTDIKGKKEVGVVSTRESEKDKPQATQVAKTEWTRVSPFFFVERAEPEVIGRETIKVPAGEFETSVAELRGFFGTHLTVWMIVDKPGIYAKVADHGNANEEGDKTELVYELVEFQLGET
jgi:hypothetical protein